MSSNFYIRGCGEDISSLNIEIILACVQQASMPPDPHRESCLMAPFLPQAPTSQNQLLTIKLIETPVIEPTFPDDACQPSFVPTCCQ